MAGLLRILLATDFGNAAALARGDAALLSRTHSVPVDVVHVHASVPRTKLSAEVRDARTQAHLNECREALLREGAQIGELRVSSGSAAETVLHTAEALDSSLIVIGAGDRAHGEQGTGATAETVARFARQPVWISRPRREPGLAKVLVAVDRSEASREALGFAADLCERLAATLVIVHVLEHPDWSPGADTKRGELAEHEERSVAALADFLTSAERSELSAAVRHEWGRPSEVLQRLARDEKSDLLVVGRTGLGGLRRVFLGGTAERLLRSTPCALLLTSPAGPG